MSEGARLGRIGAVAIGLVVATGCGATAPEAGRDASAPARHDASSTATDAAQSPGDASSEPSADAGASDASSTVGADAAVAGPDAGFGWDATAVVQDGSAFAFPDAATVAPADAATTAFDGGGVPRPDGGTAAGADAAAPACVPKQETCDGLDEDCDGMADNGLAGCDRCAPYHELPVVTHWSNAANAVQSLASDQATIWQAYPGSGGAYVPGGCYPIYAGGRLPDLDRYVGDVWSVAAIPDAEATSALRGVCQAAGIPVRLLRPDALGGPGVPSRLRSRPGAVQVVHGIEVAGSLATAVLPPNWDAAAAPGTYPIVANGFYDLNENVFRLEGPDLVRMIALSGAGGRTGAIGVLWNGGGALASRTMNPKALDQFAAVVDGAAQVFGADRHRILMYGGSRGGVTTLNMASNPKGHDYTVTFAAPAVPPTRIGEHSLLQSTTFTGVLDAVGWSTGFGDAWRTGWTYPACAGRPALTGLTGPQAHLHVLTGTSDPSYADANLSLIAPAYIAGLKAAGTEVYLESGSHDFIVPFAHQVEYARALASAGVPLHFDVNVRAGHWSRSEAGGVFGPVRTNRVWEALQAYVDPSKAGQKPKVVTGTSFYRVDRATGQAQAFTPAGGAFPFTFEAPRYVARGQRFPMVFVGEPGTAWEATLAPPGGATPYVWTGTIEPSARSLVFVDVPADQALGDYAYGLRIQKPGGGWQAVDPSSTPAGAPAVLTVVDVEPNVSASEVAVAATPPQLPGFGGTNWGLSEY